VPRGRPRNITEAARREAARLGLEYAAIAIRDQRTRWGSCSRRGTLSFSWRLLLAPAEVLEYVVVHELCHLREPNHSQAFWLVLDAARPGWQVQARWLREHGQELQDYRPAAALG
jgi:predicted metal-dependent hydrolase